jgi:hypothetical protein
MVLGSRAPLLVLAALVTAAPAIAAPPARNNAPPARIATEAPSGARGDGATDDRAAIQAAIDRAAAHGGGVVALPAGKFAISRADGQPYGLRVPGGVQLRGAGQDRTMLLQLPGTPESVRLVFATGADIAIEDLTLDGGKRGQTPNEHRHGVFALDTDRLIVRRVTAQNFTGDGFYLYKGANRSTFTRVLATGNDRNGLTLGGAADGTVIEHSKFIANKAQQVDSEPGGSDVVSNTRLVDNDLDTGGASEQYVLTCSGTSAATPGRGWTVTGNRIHGGIFVVWADRVVIADNTGTNPTRKPSVSVYRSSSDVTIRRNRFTVTAAGVAGIAVIGTQASGPRRVVITGNTIETTSPTGLGIQATGAETVTITDNTLRGAGRRSPGNAGIILRAANPAVDFESAIVRGNRISNFGERGIAVMGNGAARLRSLEIVGNQFSDETSSPSMTEAISLDDGTGAARQISVIGNQLTRGVRTTMTNLPANVPVLVSGTRGAGGRYELSGSPEGTLAETPGAIVIHRPAGAAGAAGAAAATTYVKRTGKDAKTGWVAAPAASAAPDTPPPTR